MSTVVVERLGSATLRHIEYVGALVIQLGNAFGSLGRTLPLVGNRNRWRSAIGQMLAVGVDAFPPFAPGSSWRCKGLRNSATSGRWNS
jgi:hypothetical protein